MAITYDGGSGLFDKIGPVVSLVNALETWQTSTGAGNLEKEFADLELEIEELKQFDRIAMTMLHEKWKKFKETLNNQKVRTTELVRLFMCSEICIQDFFPSTDSASLVAYLRQAMIRDAETVDASAVGGSNGVISGGSAHSVQLYSRGSETNVAAEASCRIDGRGRVDSYRFETVNVTPGREAMTIHGTAPLSKSPGHPNWDYLGIIVANYPIRGYDRNNLIPNGGLSQIDGSGRLREWVFSGVWGTDAKMTASPQYGATPNVLQYIATKNGRFSQLITGLKPNTKYFLIATVDFDDGTADGDFTVSIAGQTSSVDITTLDPNLNDPVGLIFNTQDLVTDYPLYFERTSGTAGYFNVVGIALWEFTFAVPAYKWILLYNTPLGFDKPTYPTTLGYGDHTAIAHANGKEGLFQVYFSRFFGVNLPGDSGGSETINDSLAA